MHQQCQELLDQRLLEIHQAYQDSRQDLQAESRSTAGDKHETGRAMIQLEQEKMSKRLQETQKLKEWLHRISANRAYSTVQSGSLIRVSGKTYYLSIPLGLINHEGEDIYTLAPASPLGQQLLKKSVGDTLNFRGQQFKIEDLI